VVGVAMMDYEKRCAAKARLAMRGHNRALALRWVARLGRIGALRRRVK
jgi:hypothetical protein